jgi:hypothetical protein
LKESKESLTKLKQGQIVAIGGGGFSMEPENPLLDDFVLSLAQRKRRAHALTTTANPNVGSCTVQLIAGGAPSGYAAEDGVAFHSSAVGCARS